MRQIFSVLSALWIGAFCYGQRINDKIDSLNTVIKNYPELDTNRIKAFYNRSYAIMGNKPAEAIKDAEQGLSLSLKLKWDRGIALAYRQKSVVYYFSNDFARSLEYSQQAMRAAEKLNDKLFEATVYSNMANIYADFGEHEKALDYYQKLLANAEAAHSKNYMLIAYTNIGSVYIDQKAYKKGGLFFEKALVIAREQEDAYASVSILNNLGKVNERLENYPLAVEYYQKAIGMADTTKNDNIKAVALSNLALVYFKLGKYAEATDLSKQAIALAKEVENVTCQSEAWGTLSKVYEQQKNDGASLNAYKNHILLRDSILGDKKKQAIAKKEMQFDFEKKEAVLNALHKAEVGQQQTVRNGVIGGAAVLLAGGLLSFVFYKRKRDAVQKQLQAEFKNEVTDTEMKALRAQMNPHFIFNSLNSIGDYIVKNDTQSAGRYLGKFARLMRMILENAEQREVSLDDDLKALELYMQLEALRMNHKFTYEIMVDEKLDRAITMVPPLILQPFVENSIWHGIAHKEGTGKILIWIKKEGEDMINCIVEDDGVGRQPAAQLKTSLPDSPRHSLGMKITQARIDILNKLKNTRAVVQLSDLAQGLRVEVRLPYATQF